MTDSNLLGRIQIEPTVLGGLRHVRGTRIPIDVILDGIAEGLTAEDLVDHYPRLTVADIRAAAAYAAELAREGLWKPPAAR